MKLLGGLGRLILFFATMVFTVGVSLFVVGAYLITWPVLRQNPRTQKKTAMMGLAVALFALAQAFAADMDDDTDDPYPSPPAFPTDPVENTSPVESAPEVAPQSA